MFLDSLVLFSGSGCQSLIIVSIPLEANTGAPGCPKNKFDLIFIITQGFKLSVIILNNIGKLGCFVFNLEHRI